MATPLQMLDGTETGNRNAYASLATIGLTLFGAYEVAPILLQGGVGLPGWVSTVEGVGNVVHQFPWIQSAAVAGFIPYITAVTKRIPRKVEVTRIVKGSWKVPIGKTYRGKWVYHDFDKIPHAKVGGLTGTGKTKALETILGVLTQQHEPHELQILIIDMKGGASFAHFERLPHVVDVFADTERAQEAVESAHTEMVRRLTLVKAARRDFKPIPRFSRLLLVIDEGGELSPAYAHTKEEAELRKQIMDRLSSIARIGREPMVSILYGTQRPSHETLPVSIRGQMDATFAFRTRSKGDSTVLMEHEGAEHIKRHPGRMIYQTPNGEMPVQGSYVRDEMLKTWIMSFEVDEAEASKLSDAVYKVDTSDGLVSSPSIPVVVSAWGD